MQPAATPEVTAAGQGRSWLARLGLIAIAGGAWLLAVRELSRRALEIDGVLDGLGPLVRALTGAGRLGRGWILSQPLLAASAVAVLLALLAGVELAVRRNWRLAAAAGPLILGLAAQALIVGLDASGGPFWPWLPIGLYAASAGWLFLTVTPDGPAEPGDRAISGRAAAAGLAVIVALGLAVRLYHLDRQPPGIGSHEVDQLQLSLPIMEGRAPGTDPGLGHLLRQFLRDGASFSNFATAGWFCCFGVSVVSMRLLAVTFGTISIPAFYWFLGSVFGSRRLGLIGAWLWAFSPYMINFSRYASERAHAMTPLHAVLVGGLLAGAVRTGSLVRFAAAGILIGLSGTLYEPSYFVPPLAAVALASAVFDPKSGGRIRRRAAGAAVALGLAGLLGYPRLASVVRLDPPGPGFLEVRDWPISDAAALAGQARTLVRQMFVGSVGDPWFDRGGPTLGAALLPFLVLGLALALRRWRRFGHRYAVLWLLAGSLPPMLAPEVVPRRCLLLLPAAYLLAALAIEHVLRAVDAAGRTVRATVGSLAAAGLLALGLIHTHVYFDLTRVRENGDPCIVPLGLEVARALPARQVYVIARSVWTADLIGLVAFEKLDSLHPAPYAVIGLRDLPDLAPGPPSGPDGTLWIAEDPAAGWVLGKLLGALHPGARSEASACMTRVWLPPGSRADPATIEEVLGRPPEPFAGGAPATLAGEFGQPAAAGRTGEPRRIAVGPGGEIVLARQSPLQIEIFDRRTGASRGLDLGGLSEHAPEALACSTEALFLATSDRRLRAIDLSGYSLAEIETEFPIMGLACSDERLYAVLWGEHAVRILDHDLRPLGSLGREGVRPGELAYPIDVALDAAGRLLVLDLRQRVQILDPDDGRLVAWFPCPAEIWGDKRPGVRALGEELTLVTDPRHGAIGLFSDGRPVDFGPREGGLLPRPEPQTADFAVRGSELVICRRAGPEPAAAVAVFDLEPTTADAIGRGRATAE